MATISAKCQGTYGSHYTLYLDYKINSQDITNNTSNITLHMYAKSDSSSYKAYNLNSTNPVAIKVNGSNKFSRNQAMDFRNMKTVDMGTWTGDVGHNAEGRLTITISGTFTINGTSSLSGGSVSKSWTLTTIPRASSVTCADGNIGSATTININRASSSFTHTITYSFSGLTGTIATKTSSTSIGWTVPTSFYAKIPNAKSGKVTITCDTYSGNTKVGTKTTTANVFVINSEPTISATIIDTNTTTVALTGNNSKMIKYFSNAKVDITATAKNSATIISRKVVCGNKSGTAISNMLNGVESGTFAVSCTDSRGFSNSITLTKTLVEYIKLVFINTLLVRPSTTSNTINATIKGNYFNGNFGNTTNTLSMKWRYREVGGSWGSYTTISPTIANNTFTYSASLGNLYDYNESYEFEFVATDKLMTVTQKITVTRGIPIIDIGKNDVKVNGEFYVNEKTLEDYLKQKRNIKVNYGGGTNSIDPNTSEYGLILTNKNTPNGLYFYIDTFFYTDEIKAQIAYGYNNKEIYYRYKYPATANWESWTKMSSEDSGWKNLGYTSGYVSPGFGSVPQYKRIENQIFLRGTSKKSSGNLSGTANPFGTLPTGYRPKTISYFIAKTDGANYVTGQVNTDGTIDINTGSPGTKTWVSLDNISFFID